ncbi:MAG TPA: response regulator transcription factor [Myxococcaceae bacterium]|nr:response regulator transcription factor [Myxococcaceae bacterium]
MVQPEPNDKQRVIRGPCSACFLRYILHSMSPALSEASTRVLLVGSDPLARGGLAAVVAERAELTLVGQRGLTDDLAGVDEALQPDVVIWDLGTDSAPSLERLRDSHPDGPVLALVSQESAAREALAAGARGALFRSAPSARLGAAVRALAQDLVVVDEGLLSALQPSRSEPGSGPDVLTSREHQVVQLLASGLSNKEIATRLGISEHTAKFHVNAILSKLGAQSRTEAVVRAARLGLVAL